MKLSAREDIKAPLDRVYASLVDFDALELQGLRRGLSIDRIEPSMAGELGLAWQVGFDFRGKARLARAEVTELRPGKAVSFQASGRDYSCQGGVELTGLAPCLTRMHVTVNMLPETFKARLVLFCMGFAKGLFSRRFKARVKSFAHRLLDVAGP
ncbi:MAG: SRPBCC family protein [Pseudomonadota bacterium]